MKAKVLKYKFDGNTVVAPYMELEAYAENIYLSLSDKNEYGNENYDYFHVVCKVENIYFSCGQYSREMLGREEQKEKLVKYCKNWIANMLQDAENGNHVSLEAYRKKQEQRRQEQKEQEEEKRRLEEAKWQQELDEEKQKFLNGEYIPANMFLEITKRDGFEIHIRTKETLNRHVCGLNKSGSIRFYKKRGCRTPDFSGCHKAIAAYLTFLETITES